MSVNTRLAAGSDHAWLAARERHITPEIVQRKIDLGEILLITLHDSAIGWLRWGYFWDERPFMNMLFILPARRGGGYGREIVTAWETQMRQAGHGLVMVSTQSDEDAQHFYRKLGYADCGSLILPGDVLEILMVKPIDQPR